MRSDAAANRAAIVAAARDLFADAGADVPLDAIADRAGVGIATLYRRFPDRHALVRAVALETIDGLCAALALAEAEPDPALAWRRFAGAAVDARIGAVAPALAPTPHLDVRGDPEVAAAREQMLARAERLVARCHRAGTIRKDVSASEALLAIIVVTRPLPNIPAELSTRVAPRMLTLLEAGLRPDGARLPGAARTLARDLRAAGEPEG